MKYFQEITVWDAGYHVPNHIYYLTDSKSKVVGYIKSGTQDLKLFNTPKNFDVRGRKFQVLDRAGEPDSVYFPKQVAQPDSTNTVATVEGSGGKKYFITKTGKSFSCSCPGFGFRRKCRHISDFTDGAKK